MDFKMKSSNLFGAAFMTSALVLSPVAAYADEIQTNDDIDADDVHIAVTGNFVEKADTLFDSEEEAVSDMKKHQEENLTEKNIVVYENIKQEIVKETIEDAIKIEEYQEEYIIGEGSWIIVKQSNISDGYLLWTLNEIDADEQNRIKEIAASNDGKGNNFVDNKCFYRFGLGDFDLKNVINKAWGTYSFTDVNGNSVMTCDEDKISHAIIGAGFVNVVKYVWDYEWNYGRIDINEDSDAILEPNDEPIINDNPIIEPDTSDDKYVSEVVVIEDANHHNEFMNEVGKTPNTNDGFRIVAVQGFAVMIVAAILALLSRIF